jgi:uncharacterized protein (TIGR00369 family)
MPSRQNPETEDRETPTRRSPTTESQSPIEKVLANAPFIADLGVSLSAVGPNWLETELAIVPRLRQQHGYVHAGVVTTLADHTAGGAASTVVGSNQSVLTADFTVHLLRPASGELLRCRAEVVKSGKRLIVTQADVWDGDSHCARYLGTMAVVDQAL